MARPLAGPPSRNIFAGMSSVVTKLVAIRKTLMMSAAVASSLRVLRMRAAWFSPLDERHDRDAGFKSREPQRKLGEENHREAQHGQRIGMLREERLPPVVEDPRVARQSMSAATVTIPFSRRYMATSTTAIPMASLKPLRKMAPRIASKTSVTPIWLFIQPGVKGLS